MFNVDADCFTIKFDNGYIFTIFPCSTKGVPAFYQLDFDENNPQPQPFVKINVTGNGVNVNHLCINPQELAQQILSFYALRKPVPNTN